MSVTPSSRADLEALAARRALSPALALGLGAGLYFEYFRRPAPAPTRFLSGLHRDLEAELVSILDAFHSDPSAAVCCALEANALRFNLDGAPTTGLLGLEMLAEELFSFDDLPDAPLSLASMAQTIHESDALFRRTYVAFLNAALATQPRLTPLASGLAPIATEWDALAAALTQCALSPAPGLLERAGHLARRLALREEHFWGQVLDAVSSFSLQSSRV